MSNSKDEEEPCDVGLFAPLKAAYRDEADSPFRGSANTIGKQQFTSLYHPARKKAFHNEKYHKSMGLRVLRVIPKPPAQSHVSLADDAKVGSRHQDIAPQTPLAPVSAEGLALLLNLIKQDAHSLVGSLERHIQKLSNAAQVSFTKCAILETERALLHNQYQMLSNVNNEAKVRRSTRLIMLGKAKVISFEDIEVAQVARATKDAKKGKGKRGRKRKSAALEADMLEGDKEEEEPEVAHAAKEITKGKEKRGRKRKSTAVEAGVVQSEVAQTIEVPWRAPVARMY